MPPVEPPPVYVARPTVRLNGEEDERISALLTGLVMSEQEGGLSALELRLGNSASLAGGGAEYAFDAGGPLKLGAALVVGTGDASAPVEIFRGRVTGLEGVFRESAPPELLVLAEDALQALRLRRRTRVFEDQSFADIVRTIAGDHGLTAEIDGLTMQFGTEVQLNETDLGFLRRLLARVDADLQVVADELHVSARRDVRRGEVELALGEELKSARILADLAHQVTAATVQGWSLPDGAVQSARAEPLATGPGTGKAGADVLQETLGARTHHVCHHFTASQAEADALAAAVRDRRARRFVRIQGVTTGTPALRVGSHARVSGVGAWFSNTYYVTSVRHLYDREHGYRTEFEGQCAFLGS